ELERDLIGWRSSFRVTPTPRDRIASHRREHRDQAGKTEPAANRPPPELESKRCRRKAFLISSPHLRPQSRRSHPGRGRQADRRWKSATRAGRKRSSVRKKRVGVWLDR